MMSNLDELQDSESWDFEHPEAKTPVRKSRVVVSVAFRGDDFDLVAESAEHFNMKTSEFIRNAALEKATTRAELLSVRWQGTSEGSFTIDAAFAPQTYGTANQAPEEEPLTLSA